MRKFSCLLIGIGLLLSSCQKDDMLNDAVVTDGSGNVNFTISPQDMMGLSRSYNAGVSNSAKGGITNVDMNQYDLRYKLAVYRVDEGGVLVEVVAPQLQRVDAYREVSYSLRLTPNRKYKFVVWADFVTQGSDADLHYNTADMQNITCKDADEVQLNDESRDAYFITDEETVGAEGLAKTLTLKRPFAKVRVITTDWDVTQKNVMPDNFKITYYGCERFSGINAVTGKYTNKETLADKASATHVYTGKIDKANKEYAIGYDNSDVNRTLMVDYLMTDEGSVQTPIHFNFQALSGTEEVSQYDFKQNIPIQRNYLTTLIGNLLTANTSITIKIDENFNDEYSYLSSWFESQGYVAKEPAHATEAGITTYTITNRYELIWVAEHPEILKGDEIIKIANDIDMNGVDWMPIGPRDGAFGGAANYGVIDGQGHTLRNFSVNAKHLFDFVRFGGLFTFATQAGVIGCFYGTIKNVTFENITIGGLQATNETTGTAATDAYWAAPIGYCGASLENVHSKHVVIKGEKTEINVGGLIGYIDPANPITIKNCSAEDVHVSGNRIGGLVGGLSLAVGQTILIEGCKTDYVYLRVPDSGSLISQAAGGFIGAVDEGTGLTLRNCTAPQHVEYLHPDGSINTTYTPAHALYGNCAANADKIVIE